jgi:tetratricopeptide (TPR) repeat protein
MEKALSLPGASEELSVVFYCGNGYYFARDFAQGEAFYRTVLERVPYHEGARVLLAKCLLHQGRLTEALAELDAAEETYGLSGDYWRSHAQMERGRIHILLGEPQKAERLLEQLMDGATRQNRRIAVSVLFFLLGRVDEAMDWAEAAVDAREPHVNAFRKAPEFPEEMRAHPRFQALLERVGLHG